jgi:hypothetical protein
MTHYMREVPMSERPHAAEQAMKWGYPREILPEEVRDGTWINYRDRGLVWFVTGPVEDSVAVHAIAKPACGIPLGSPEAMHTLEVVAELLGAKRVYSMVPEWESNLGKTAKLMRRYLRMRGWEQTDIGVYKELGGV